MAMRTQRFISGRDTPADSARCMFVSPIWTGETLRSIYVDGYAMTRGAGAGAFGSGETSFPDQPSEINWHIIYVPWRIAITHAGTASTTAGGLHSADALQEIDSVSEFDQVFRNLMFEFDASGSEYYGYGEAHLEPIRVAQARLAEADQAAQNSEAQNASVAERGALEDMGIVRLFGREVFMRPFISDGDGKVRFGDDVNLSLDGMDLPGPAFVMGGVIRYEIDVETNFNVEVNDTHDRFARNLLVSGDANRVQSHILHDASGIGDKIRTQLFGGDYYIESNTVRESKAKVNVKGAVTVETPYRLMRFGA